MAATPQLLFVHRFWVRRPLGELALQKHLVAHRLMNRTAYSLCLFYAFPEHKQSECMTRYHHMSWNVGHALKLNFTARCYLCVTVCRRDCPQGPVVSSRGKAAIMAPDYHSFSVDRAPTG